MRSAYADALGAEPELTNWAFTRGSEGDFKDTLDYIFVSDGVDVAGVKPIRVTEGPLPTEAEPSDHVLIAADLSVQAAPPPPPPSRTKWTRRVPRPVLIRHAARACRTVATKPTNGHLGPSSPTAFPPTYSRASGRGKGRGAGGGGGDSR